MFLIFTGRCDLCRSLLLLLVCGLYGELVRIHFPNLPWKRQKHFRTLQLFIMYCWPQRNVSMRKVTNSLREFTRCSFLSKNILTLNVPLAQNAPTLNLSTPQRTAACILSVRQARWYYLWFIYRERRVTVWESLSVSFIIFCSVSAGQRLLFLITRVIFSPGDP